MDKRHSLAHLDPQKHFRAHIYALDEDALDEDALDEDALDKKCSVIVKHSR